MVAIFGDITGQDDYTHALGPEPNFNESMYFNFFDRARKSGGFLRLGNRANEGYAEMTLDLYLPDGSVLFQYNAPEIENNDAMDAGGMRFEVIEPLEKLRTDVRGPRRLPDRPRADGRPARRLQEQPMEEGETRPRARGRRPRVRQHRRATTRSSTPRRSSPRPTTSST